MEAASGERDMVELWEGILGQALFPLGEAFLYMILLVAEDGRVVAGDTDVVHFIGEDIDDALEVLIRAHRRPTQIN
jgi:SUKH-3 immunity protein